MVSSDSQGIASRQCSPELDIPIGWYQFALESRPAPPIFYYLVGKVSYCETKKDSLWTLAY